MNKIINEYIKDIINQQYSNNYIKEKVFVIAEKLTDYYGEKYLNTIIDAIRSVDIFLCPFEKEMTRFIDDHLYIKIDNYYDNFLNRNLINSRNGISYSISPNIIYDKNNEEFVNKGINRKIIFLKELSHYANNLTIENNEQTITRMLIHEFIIQIKGIHNNNNIRNGKRISRNGVHISYSLINEDNDLVTLDFLSESGKGLNLAMCEYDTLKIFANLFGFESKKCMYPLEVEILKRIIKDNDLIDYIHTYEINGEIPELRNIYDSKFYDGAFDKTIALFDKITQAPYRNNKEIYDKLKDEASGFIKTLTENGKSLIKTA